LISRRLKDASKIDLKWLKGRGLYKKEAIIMNIIQLPNEMVCHIAQYLGLQKISLALTCKQFNGLFRKDTREIKKKLKKLKRIIHYVS
jgi:hypothetical protein